MSSNSINSSPYIFNQGPLSSVSYIMTQVLIATIPGIIALVYFFGWGVLFQTFIAATCAILCEALILKLRKRPVINALRDNSALVSALLLAIALPPYAPWWIAVSGSVFAILIAKQLYGGLGYNPFNPAMAAYVFLLISFPVEMTTWATPRGTETAISAPSPQQSWLYIFSENVTADALSMATALDAWRNEDISNISELRVNNPSLFGAFGGMGWEYVNLGFLLGGCYLLRKRVFTWHAPLGFLASFSLLTALFNSEQLIQSLAFHLFSGATMLGAFFIITDPVSSAVSNPARLWYGIGAGALLFILRNWSNYPDAVAFSVLLMNFVAPLLDHYLQPRVYGRKKRGKL